MSKIMRHPLPPRIPGSTPLKGDSKDKSENDNTDSNGEVVVDVDAVETASNLDPIVSRFYERYLSKESQVDSNGEKDCSDRDAVENIYGDKCCNSNVLMKKPDISNLNENTNDDVLGYNVIDIDALMTDHKHSKSVSEMIDRDSSYSENNDRDQRHLYSSFVVSQINTDGTNLTDKVECNDIENDDFKDSKSRISKDSLSKLNIPCNANDYAQKNRLEKKVNPENSGKLYDS